MNKFLKTAAVAAVASFAISGSANAALSAFGFEGGLPAPRAPDSVLYNFDVLGDLSMIDPGYNPALVVIHDPGSDGAGAQNRCDGGKLQVFHSRFSLVDDTLVDLQCIRGVFG